MRHTTLSTRVCGVEQATTDGVGAHGRGQDGGNGEKEEQEERNKRREEGKETEGTEGRSLTAQHVPFNLHAGGHSLKRVYQCLPCIRIIPLMVANTHHVWDPSCNGQNLIKELIPLG